MEKVLGLLLLCLIVKSATAQEGKEKVERACLDYIEGFYEGDTAKLINCLQPGLYKFGFMKNESTGKYNAYGHMSFSEAVNYAKRVYAAKRFAKPDAVKKVEILDMMNSIASAKVTAWWGVDYILLSKQEDKWMIEEVLWQGPLQQ